MSEIGEQGPYIKQMMSEPVFRGSDPTGINFCCGNLKCNHILFENYTEGSLLDIAIECFRCGHLTRSPFLEPGEILPAFPILLADEDKLQINQTIIAYTGTVMTSNRQALLEIEACRPRHKDNDRLILDLGCYLKLSEAYNLITGAKLEKQQQSIGRGANPGTFPFAASMLKFSHFLSDQSQDSLQDFRLNCAAIVMFDDAVKSWSHHPRFLQIASGLGKMNSFYHTIGQLFYAKHLSFQGIRIGLSLENVPGEPNPDLYIRDNGRKIYIEVKAPSELQFGQPTLDENSMAQIVYKHVKKVKRQIRSDRPGALVICSTSNDQKNIDLLSKHISVDKFKSGRQWMMALIGLSINFQILPTDDGLRLKLGIDSASAINPNFKGFNPFGVPN